MDSGHIYHGFNLYFPDETNIDIKKIKEKTSYFESYINRNRLRYSFKQIVSQKYFSVSYKMVISDECLNSSWTDLKHYLINETEFCLNCFGLAMHSVITKEHEKDKEKLEGQTINVPLIRARIIEYEPVLQVSDVKVNCFGKMTTVQGTVIKAGPVKMVCTFMAFRCDLCDGTQAVKQLEGTYTIPNKCPTKGCRAKSNFEPLYNSKSTITPNSQIIGIQDLECDYARIPPNLECNLLEDLVRSCVPGDEVTITGIIKVRDPNDNKGKNKQHSLFTIYLDAISVINNKNNDSETCSRGERITFNTEDYYAINHIHSQPNLFRYLVHSLCPSIYGHEIVKAGLLLALMGGTKTESSRAESHVLMVGDPGLGKSQMLKACANVSPKGVYVCSNTSTTSGLTVTVTKESRGDYALQAGALVLADEGCCCIDEFDKVPAQHASILEAMEQQTISVAKAGVVCSLPARPTILVAANPAGGHYNKSKTVAENLKIGSPMLSRFDLIFILLDRPNEELDNLLAKHIMVAHSSSNNRFVASQMQSMEASGSSDDICSLRDKLILKNGEKIDYLPHSMFRKYIAYAQKYVHPKLSNGAKRVAKEFFISLRKQFQTGDCTPITTRQLYSLKRLIQARAKSELREEATEEDAEDVVEIMKHSLNEIFTNESGELDADRSQLGTGMSNKKKVMKLLQILQRKSENETRSVFNLNEIREVSVEVGIDGNKFDQTLQNLNIQGYLLNKGQNMYQLNSAYL